MTLQPAPRGTGGILYQSRAEARWALFLDELAVKWEYEPQEPGAEDGPQPGVFVVFAALGTVRAEVKPARRPDGTARWRERAAQRPMPSRAALLAGPPSEKTPVIVIGGKGPQEWEDDAQKWRPCPSGRHFDLAWPGAFWSRHAEDSCPRAPGGPGEDTLGRAYSAARSARLTSRRARRRGA